MDEAVANAEGVLRSGSLRSMLKAWLLERWCGIASAPPAESVVLLCSTELRDYDPGGLLFVGEMRGSAAAWHARASSDVLLPAGLARELKAASRRLCSAELAEAEWATAVRLGSEANMKPGAPAAAMEDNSYASFGRHARTLRVHAGLPRGAAGHLPLGQYENGHSNGRGQMVPNETLEHLPMVLALLRSLAPLPINLIRPRVQAIRQCSTREHSDRQRGDTVSAFRFSFGEGQLGTAALLVRTDILMCVSLCSYRGVLVVPACMRSTCPPTLLVYCWNNMGVAVEAVVPYAAVETEEWQRIGMLESVVTGLKDGRVIAAPRADSTRPGMGAAENRELEPLTPADAIGMARRNPHPTFPHRWVAIGWDGRWNGLYGWMLIHVLAGDGALLRFHVYSRQLREHPSSATVTRPQHDLDYVCVRETMLHARSVEL